MTRIKLLATFAFLCLTSLALCLFVLLVQLPLVLLGTLVWEEETFQDMAEKVYKNISRVDNDMN